jgi:hypothetical protein
MPEVSTRSLLCGMFMLQSHHQQHTMRATVLDIGQLIRVMRCQNCSRCQVTKQFSLGLNNLNEGLLVLHGSYGNHFCQWFFCFVTFH